MQLAIWWAFKRLVWKMMPLPAHPKEREIAIADRAALVLDTHLRKVRTQSYKLDPYATKSAKVSASDPKVERLLLKAIMRTEVVLRDHPLPQHLLNAMLRGRDPETIANSRKVAEEIAREAEQEKARRTHPTMPPPPLPTPSHGTGGSKESAV
jgi:hypothetical protein